MSEKKNLPVPAEDDAEYVEAEPVESWAAMREEVERRMAEIDMMFALCFHHAFGKKKEDE